MQTAQVIQLDHYRLLTPAQKLRADRENIRKTICDEKLNILSQILIEATPISDPGNVETRLVTIENQLADLLRLLKNKRRA